MKILYLITDISTSGGVERITSLKINYFIEKFHYDIDILVRNKKNKMTHFFLNSRVNIYNLDFNPNKNFFWRQIFKIKKYLYLKKLLEKNKYDLIITTGFILDPFLPFLKKHTKIIKEIHGAKNILYPKERFYLRKYLLSFDKIILLTKKDLNNWKLENAMVIYNSLTFYPKEYSLCQNRRIISVGRLVEDKGYDILIDIWSIISKKYPNWILEVYGEGTERKNLENKIIKLGLEKSFLLKGVVKNIQDKYLESSIYVMTSRTEGFGMVLVEAMACGLPIIAFDVPTGPREIIKKNNGFLVEFGNINEMVKKIEFLIIDEQKRKKMGENSRRNVQVFSQEKIMIQWKEIFEKITERE